ncbi:hypothetical protein PAMC26510_01700 [Caballeronia sordidicola]|uniref:Uncharacterized protein n=1 Tax=Caballeronia sordidicola TaxID=196367 RepID=A0A242N9I0_CABSO|nr:hypothetical protein PAMC26510_01700 [Caballeronia sordidicola]
MRQIKGVHGARLDATMALVMLNVALRGGTVTCQVLTRRE